MSDQDFRTVIRPGKKQRRFALAVCMLSACGLFIFGVWFANRSSVRSSEPALANRSPFRPPGTPDRPHIEVTADHQLKRVQHKDQSGYSPLETVQTPEGTVTIQRTFSTDGRLLKEEAFLNGKPVPVPRS